MTAYKTFPIGAPFNVLMPRDTSASLTQIEEMAKQLNARMGTLDGLITRYQEGLKKVESIPDNIKDDLEDRSKEVQKLAGELTDLQQKLVDGVNQRGVDPNSVASVLIRNKAILDQAGAIQRSKGKFQFNDLNARNIVTLVSLGSNAQFAANDLGRTVERALTLLDWISFTPVTADLVPMLRESAYEIMADLVPEGQTKPESNLTFGVVDLKVGTIAHWIKISVQLISDMPTLAAYIEGRLAYGVRLKLEAKIVVGDGLTSGARSFIGLIEADQFEVVTPEADDTAIDVINRAKYKAASTGLLPEAIILNPEDWGSIERIKGTDGHYIFGSPGAAVQPVLWGLPVILSAAMTLGKYWVGNLTLGVSAFIREDVAVELSTEDGDNFIKNLCTVRAEMRACCGVAIPDACAGGSLPTPPVTP
ncbi:phage major capsid protein [Acinetobacter seifertii]|uniref:phage major capsid protein n=1 Tax=Acinetobacter seifertii TaxID=1530123 RepID=UPI00168D730B|nr:phage major capsid protein [Acinetobacter seifertii]QNX02786.1 phage major capsid protein [Acinetobacter seifertii]